MFLVKGKRIWGKGQQIHAGIIKCMLQRINAGASSGKPIFLRFRNRTLAARPPITKYATKYIV